MLWLRWWERGGCCVVDDCVKSVDCVLLMQVPKSLYPKGACQSECPLCMIYCWDSRHDMT